MITVKRTPTSAAIEPITLEEMKLYCKIDYSTDDDLITEIIKAARVQAEQFCNKSFIASDVEYFADSWESPVKLPYPEHDSITGIVVGGVSITDYGIVGTGQKILTLYSTYTNLGKVRGDLVVNYTTTGYITDAEKLALKKIVYDMYESRINSLSDKHFMWLMPFKVY